MDDTGRERDPVDQPPQVWADPGAAAQPESVSREVMDGELPVPAVGGVPAPRPRRQRGRTLAVALTAVVVAGMIGAGAFAYSVLAGGGDQPEQHTPASAFLFAKIDLDPSAGQKLDALRFLRRLPDVGSGVSESTDLRQWAYEKLTSGDAAAPAWSSVKPWLGQRVAAAMVPGPAKGDDPDLLVVLQVADEQKARATLSSLHDTGMAIADGWAVVAKDRATAQKALSDAAASPLSKAPTFGADLRLVGENGFATTWFDAAGVRDLLNASGALGAGLAAGSLSTLSGHGAIAARFAGGRLEITGKIKRNPPAGSGPAGGVGTAATSAGTGVENLPDDTLVAVGVTGWGKAVGANWQSAVDQMQAQGTDAAQVLSTIEVNTGLKLPDDLVAVLGDRLALAVGRPDGQGNPSIGVHGESGSDASDTLGRLVAAAAQIELPLERRDAGTGWVLATTEGQANAMAAGGKLGATAGYTSTVQGGTTAVVVVYADLRGLADQYGDQIPDQAAATLRALDVVGMSEQVDKYGLTTLTIRVGGR